MRNFIQRFIRLFELGLEQLGTQDDFRIEEAFQVQRIEVSHDRVEFVQDVQTHRQPLRLEQMRISYSIQELPQVIEAVDLILRNKSYC